jgi:carbon storage regulator CsrA
MLVLGRKAGQSIYVGEDIIVTVVDIQYSHTKIGITAPDSVLILRDDAKNIRDLAGHLHPALLTRNLRKNEL